MPSRHKRRKHRTFPPVDSGAFEIERKREIVDRIRTWEECGRWACWRAQRCRTPAVACFTEMREAVVDLTTEEALYTLRLVGIPADMLPHQDELTEAAADW